MLKKIILSRFNIMGVLNVTPDSFSDGGAYLSVDRAASRAWTMHQEGADIIDVGGESTRPGSEGVCVQEEIDRIAPVLQKLKDEHFPLPISLDTSKPEVAETALKEEWADMVNDVEGLRNPRMADVVKRFECPVVLMHMFGSPRSMQRDFHYDDVVADLVDFFQKRIDESGITHNVVLDPGLGFGKSLEHNLRILKSIREFKKLGYPVMIGASRKSFIGTVLNKDVGQRLFGSLSVAAYCFLEGVSILRVHDVKETFEVVSMLKAIQHESI